MPGGIRHAPRFVGKGYSSERLIINPGTCSLHKAIDDQLSWKDDSKWSS